jgi:hypothetical protein
MLSILISFIVIAGSSAAAYFVHDAGFKKGVVAAQEAINANGWVFKPKDQKICNGSGDACFRLAWVTDEEPKPAAAP